MTLKVDSAKLIEYREMLIKQQSMMKTRLENLSNDFLRLDWDDNVMLETQDVLNEHIKSTNILLGKLEQSIEDLGKFLDRITEYLNSV